MSNQFHKQEQQTTKIDRLESSHTANIHQFSAELDVKGQKNQWITMWVAKVQNEQFAQLCVGILPVFFATDVSVVKIYPVHDTIFIDIFPDGKRTRRHIDWC